MIRRAFVTDCEGPISKNDNAFELAEHYIPDGAKFFRMLSRFDDVLAYLAKRPGYSAGYTLKLLAPFLKAYGARNRGIMEFSKRNILLIEGSSKALRYVSGLMPTYIVSTSYEQYIEALCKVAEFPVSQTFSTALDLDKLELGEIETSRLKELKEEILKMPEIDIPEGAQRLENLSSSARATISLMDRVFFTELKSMASGRLLEDTRPMGSREKAEAVRMIGQRLGTSLSEFMYVGDSITDIEAFRAVRDARGLAVSFNGNQYAVQEAKVAILSRDASALALVGEVFARMGCKGVMSLVEGWPGELSKLTSTEMRLLSSCELPRMEKVTVHNVERLCRESNSFRKTVRGYAVGSLG